MKSNDEFVPEELCSRSAQYLVIGPKNNARHREITMVKGDHFPPISEESMYYELVDKTKPVTKH